MPIDVGLAERSWLVRQVWLCGHFSTHAGKPLAQFMRDTHTDEPALLKSEASSPDSKGLDLERDGIDR
ncbi:MAG: hypothetical protein AAFV53_24290 [Myxococcota bacterium]